MDTFAVSELQNEVSPLQKCGVSDSKLPGGVMVTLLILVQPFMVRVHAG